MQITRTKTVLTVAAAVMLALGPTLAVAQDERATTATPRVIDLQVKASKVGGGAIGTFNVKPSQPIPVKVGSTYHLALLGATVSGHTLTNIPVNATFSIATGKGQISIVSQSANTVDVKITHGGPNGHQIKYVVGSGYSMKRGLASGRITVQ